MGDERMTAEEAHNEAIELAEMAKDWRLLDNDFFDRVAANPAVNPCVFNRIRQALGPEEWKEFDRAYCGYMRPQDKELVDWRERKAGEEAWERNLQQMSNSDLIKLLQSLAGEDSLQQETA